MFKEIIEGKAKVSVPIQDKISKELPVFYNPVMKFNRDISVLFLNALGQKQMQIADLMAGSGIRAIRFLLELKPGIIKNIAVNDYSQDAFAKIQENLKLNDILIGNSHDTKSCASTEDIDSDENQKIKLSRNDANLFLLNSSGFDYIDIDPFGSPNPFLDSAVRRLSRKSILAVTATDTAPLCGTYPKVCRRKYWGEPLRNELMHEIGLRILIRKVQLVGAQYDRALIPAFSYSRHHYFRIFFRCKKGKEKVDEIIKLHKSFEFSEGKILKQAGPIWSGKLWDYDLVKNMVIMNANFDLGNNSKTNIEKEKNKDQSSNDKFLNIILHEAEFEQRIEKLKKKNGQVIGYFDIHSMVKRHKLKKIPRKDALIKAIIEKGFNVTDTHFLETALRSDIDEKEFVEILKK